MKALVIFGIAAVVSLATARGFDKLPPRWQFNTGIQPERRTRQFWELNGKLGKLANLPINFRDRSGLQDEADLKKSLAGNRNDSSKLIPFADKFRVTKSPRDLQRFLLAVTSLHENGKEMAATYRGGAMHGDFCLGEYIAFRKAIGPEMNVLEAKLLILWDNTYFANSKETFDIFKKLQKQGLADRRVMFSVISEVMESYMMHGKNANLVKEMYDLASSLYVESKSQKSINTYAGAMLALGMLSHNKQMYYKGLAFTDGVAAEMAKGDAYDRAALLNDRGSRDYWVKKGKELFK